MHLGMFYNDKVPTIEKLLEKDNSATIHVANLRILTTELYKTKENLASRKMHKVFEQRDIQYNLYSQIDFQLGSVKAVNYSLRALRSLGPKIWNIVPFVIKNSETLVQFHMKSKCCKLTDCPCNLRKP